ncbi:MAG TPA: methylmalonyl-CoA epimerase [Bdellovibrionales bacterium]|nr:MAG: hypothetical protein A2Z97_04240 [Bdellovibrionales bacterium GWB1_52_6]OFZ03672.1 MAG: hypothetical protein A2X97_01100 [Bdellovibrionales bacterium GWA1_52_35]OFZ42547.1 MAG: hypothetical protein A2070_12550 [Bdellovibrionales bacterium GWC1_52_8]HAR44308.1 methylmalonyl-CoA epimerase [Bdellovibrionales bacterium]HCM40601.1 methylmalonyl-CoA epimerase [Bdellovibrionales bacterium]
MRKIRLDHIGIAVADLDALRRLFRILGLEIDHSEKNQDQRVLTHFIPLGPGAAPVPSSAALTMTASKAALGPTGASATIELLEPTDPSSAVAQFLQKRGPGIHHLSFCVEKGQLEPLCAELKNQGYCLIYNALRQGAHGMQINFIHPASAGGVLVELMEPS